ncbi:hypothetical protein MS3_00010902 [Schistosoma haematobium]|uniref:Uncharacterized protein n=1 Tax=Schistosoma haematobium TaxID=6185 RepID=A0A922IMD5_SCHHA|nr:hypothetical protein MS3_00010902 [Schistosoma haematobium]KAH9582778.1 hypothetical protein MS3_00010902 [Schistosoma haematobium]CAH8591707.1 unnamed protein product [Schistosoma haematobium]
MNYLCRVHSFQGETNNHKKEKIDPNSISGEMAELSDYTIEALESFKRKLTTYIEAVDKSCDKTCHYTHSRGLPSGNTNTSRG